MDGNNLEHNLAILLKRNLLEILIKFIDECVMKASLGNGTLLEYGKIFMILWC
jgi:hypothetical protein